jgi:uncharacterized phage protein gp47/JayE
VTIPTTQITLAGPVVPTYDDVLGALQSAFQAIFGSDVYLAPDSQDGQLLAIFAQAISDVNQQLANVYFQFSPQTATGVPLDQVIKVNGIKRKTATFSTVPLTLVGANGTIINAGIAGDDMGLGTQWAIPPGTTIPFSGTIDVTATCLTPGAILIGENHINVIVGGATAGWQSVNNGAIPSPGAPIETDMAVRQRQSISVALPALTPLETILGSIANVDGVTRYAIYENDTNDWDIHGIPAHSIAAVVEGGSTSDVCTAIARTKNPGTGTYGTTSLVVFDSAGVANTINYMQLQLVEITIVVGLRALSGYVATTAGLISTVIAAWITQLPIGSVVYLDKIRSIIDLQGSIATEATGRTQAELDNLSDTYVVYSIAMSRSPNITETTVTAGPYTAGTTVITVTDASRLYPGQPISIVLDDATIFNVNISPTTPISGDTVTLATGIPTSRSILTDAIVKMTADIPCAFYEAPYTATVDITINAS